MNVPTLTACNENFGLRKLERGDVPLLTALKSETWRRTHRSTIVNADDQNRWFDSMQTDVNQPDKLFLAFVQRKGDRDVAGFFKLANVDYISRCADVGWDLVPDYRGKGLGKVLVGGGASFCFNFLNLRRLTAEILINNEASQKCAQASGFVVEGLKREAVYERKAYDKKNLTPASGGHYIDSQVWGLLRSEWRIGDSNP
jgi:RimJ/RimL family protein N-acetyltransferase